MSDLPLTPPSVRKAPWPQVVMQALVMGVVIYYLYRLVADHWDQLDLRSWRLRWDSLLLSVGLGVSATLTMAGGWAWSLHMLSAPLQGWRAVRVWMLTNFLKYVPGKIWLLIARYLACERLGVGRGVFLTSFVYEFFLLIVGGVLATIATVPFWGSEARLGRYWWVLAMMAVTLAALHPRVFGLVTGWALARLGREPLRRGFLWQQVLQLAFAFAGAWLLYGAGFALMAEVLLPVRGDSVPALMGTFIFSFVLGQVAVITPGGLGVREVAFTALLLRQFPDHVAAVAVLAVVSRLWTVLVEVVALLPVVVRPGAGAAVPAPDSRRAGSPGC